MPISLTYTDNQIVLIMCLHITNIGEGEMKYAILNGKVLEKKDANISVFNKAMFFDFAVYDSMKVIKGKPFFPEFHADRLLESAKVIELEHKFTKKADFRLDRPDN